MLGSLRLRSGPRCNRCNIELPEGSTRCPQCLRTSTVVDASKPAEGAAEEAHPRHVGVRVIVAVIAYAVYAPIVWLILERREWLEPRGLWLSGVFTAGTLAMLPLRMAFAPPDEKLAPKSPLAEYGVRMASVLGFAAALGLATFAAGHLTSEPLATIFLALFFFLVPVLGGSAMIAARKRQEPFGRALLHGAKGIGVAALIVGGLVFLFLLRVAARPEPKTIYIAEDPKSFLDPMDVESVPIKKAWRTDSEGATLDLEADGGDFDRTLLALQVAASSAVDGVVSHPNASGAIDLWIPKHLDTPANHAAAEKAADDINSALRTVGKKTPKGPIHLLVLFGSPPR